MIGDVVKLKRLARRMSQSALAKQSGLNANYISQLEKGASVMGGRARIALEKVLGELE
jgi:transcriptional regulator with XRE-family HTH domain